MSAHEDAKILFDAGRFLEAQSVCHALLAQNPADIDTLNLLGMIAGLTSRMDAAIEHFRRAIVIAPGNAAILANLAEALRLQQKSDEALTIVLAGLAHNPQDHNLNGLAAELLMHLGRPQEAAPYLFIALTNAPGHDPHWKRLNGLLVKIALEPAEGRRWLLNALCHPYTRPREIAGSVVATLYKDPAITGLLDLAARDALPGGKALDDRLSWLGNDVLLLQLMVSTVVPLFAFERCFTGLRRGLLLEIESHSFSLKALHFSVALAIQSYLTDYVWFLTDEEEEAVDRLADRLDAALRSRDSQESLPLWLAVLGAYRPLHRMKRAAEIAQMTWPKSVATLIRIQITEPLKERELRGQIPSLTPVSNPVSQQVRAQYEENPYPRWVSTGRVRTGLTFPHLLAAWGGVEPTDPGFVAPDVLIAGCGTGEQSITAAYTYNNAKILAVDLSMTSLGYALRKTQEYGIRNIEYRQGDILELAGLGRTFHMIECTGVLHHLADPLAGWRILVDQLHAGGGMYIALYSESARYAVVRAREDIARKGYAATVADIRRYRRDLLELPSHHPVASLQLMNDFYNISECRDLLFHVQEHRFTLPQIKKALNELGLRFLGFNLADATAYRKRFPEDPRMTSLDNWHALEQDNPDTFINMYQFWVQKI